IFDGLAEADCLLGGPDAITIKAHAILREGGGNGAIDLQLVIGREHAGLDFVSSKSVALLELPRICHYLIDGSHFAKSGFGVRIAEETVGGKGNAVPQLATQNLIYGHIPGLP